jgi:hypothetical protein
MVLAGTAPLSSASHLLYPLFWYASSRVDCCAELVAAHSFILLMLLQLLNYCALEHSFLLPVLLQYVL